MTSYNVEVKLTEEEQVVDQEQVILDNREEALVLFGDLAYRVAAKKVANA